MQAVWQSDRFVREAADPAQREEVRPDLADHDSAAGRPEVDRDDRGGFASWHCLGHRRYRRNAAATPASTGMCRPVVWTRSGPTSANTALATWSGSTSRLSSVRWA